MPNWKRRPRPHLFAALAIALAVLTLAPPGCAIGEALKPAPVAPGENVFIVNGERTIQSTFTIVNEFLKIDNANRELMRTGFPAAHAFAENLRETAPPTFRAAWMTLQAVKATPTDPAAGDAAARELAAMEAIGRQVREYLAQLNASGARLATPPSSGAGGGLPRELARPPSRT